MIPGIFMLLTFHKIVSVLPAFFMHRAIHLYNFRIKNTHCFH